MNLFEQYMKDLNTYDSTPDKKVRRLSKSMSKNIDRVILYVLAFSVGVMTLKVAIEQMIMQLGVYLK